MPITRLANEPRLYFAAAAAVTGLIVSVAMVTVGGPSAKYLPAGWVHAMAIPGAGVAALLCADAFGHARGWGWAVAFLGGALMTVLGGAVGAGLLGMGYGQFHGWGLGVVAIIDASMSGAAVGIWAVLMALLHLGARKMREGWMPPRMNWPFPLR
ncbi:hypothetical protein [Sulfitobacter sp. S190]|uniref:hypothetical protein n=1 Tax=Sulfitobacter sp. S190 TaxID=2867022 RepID=UPI0021A26FCB|nr:hypothetical protein [Sulfitobacter sp. S190]UWR23635.1 hypothetical protein K3756_06605 [Sulfitobacter sp. S190]